MIDERNIKKHPHAKFSSGVMIVKGREVDSKMVKVLTEFSPHDRYLLETIFQSIMSDLSNIYIRYGVESNSEVEFRVNIRYDIIRNAKFRIQLDVFMHYDDKCYILLSNIFSNPSVFEHFVDTYNPAKQKMNTIYNLKWF